MNRLTRILLAAATGLLLTPPFMQWGSGFVILFAFVPLLLVEEHLYRHRERHRTRHIFWYAVIAFVIFNILASWWVKNAAWIGVIGAVLVNTTLMTAVWWLFHWVKRQLGPRLGYASLVVLWVAMEFLYLNVDVNFPWLLMGNAWANDIMFIQWYEVTGALGGSLWVMIINVLLVRLLNGLRENPSFHPNRSKISWLLGFLILPMVISLVRYYTYEEDRDPYQVVVIQPNIDPYLKFIDMPQEEQNRYLLQIADSLTTPQTDYIVAPETFLNNNVWQEQLDRHPDINLLRRFLSQYPDAALVIGATTYRRYTPENRTVTARPIREGAAYFDSFNSALQLDRTDSIPLYHKSRLVVGVEFMPFTGKVKWIDKITVNLGGIMRSHGTQSDRETFAHPDSDVRVAPIICWESIFGEYVTRYVRNHDAGFLFVITNDGWWGDTPGHRQHNSYARLRAIETRRSVARSANTGISSLINQRGDEIARLGWWERSGLRGTLNANDHLTFYVRYGDFTGRLAGFLAGLFLLYALTRRLMSRRG